MPLAERTFCSQVCGVLLWPRNELAVYRCHCYRAGSSVGRTGLRLRCALRAVNSGREFWGLCNENVSGRFRLVELVTRC